ncbi:MAG: folylpolyglutamate synthase/dihydrofolate synthase family protein [Pseudanabaena sp. ELA607]
MTTAASTAILEAYAKFGIHLGLARIQQLLAALDNPHLQMPVIHIAGTNGKGSVCAYVSSILQAAGYRVGRYISPHLVDWRERITINGEWITEDDLLAALAAVEAVIQPDQEVPTQFEVSTAAAWWYFARQDIDIAVIETGLGGRLDATNVCPQPAITVITSISRDHWQRLGDSLGQIASEKAGIMKAHCPIVVGTLPPDAANVIEQKAESLDAPLIWVKVPILDPEEPQQILWHGQTYRIPLLGTHQRHNAAIALTVIEQLRAQDWLIPDSAVREGLSQTTWAGRLQWVTYRDAQNQSHALLLDGAHNVAGAELLREYVSQNFPAQPIRWVVGILNTKDQAGILQALLQPQDHLFAVPVPDHATTAPEMLCAISRDLLHTPAVAYANLRDGLTAALHDPLPTAAPVIVCGSLYLVGQLLAQIRH